MRKREKERDLITKVSNKEETINILNIYIDSSYHKRLPIATMSMFACSTSTNQFDKFLSNYWKIDGDIAQVFLVKPLLAGR